MRKLTLSLLTLFLSLLFTPPVLAQNWLRSLSNALSGGSNQPVPAQNSSATATIGVRGMDEDSPQVAAATSANTKALDSWAASRIEAETAARKRGLTANMSVKLAADSAPAQEGSGQ